jgi:soluble lytic murein transglycosylase-like protein
VKAIGAAMIVLGVGYIVFRGQSANATPLAILRPAEPDPVPPRAAPGANDYLAIINAVNAEDGLGLDPADVLAFIAVESSFRPNAYRYEAKLRDASYGLMQILYKTARGIGYDGPPEGLYDPETNIRFGMRYLAYVRDFLRPRLGREPDWQEIASGYNGGPGRVVRGWRSVAYVEKWRLARASIEVA